MKEDAVLRLIRSKLVAGFGTIENAARNFGRTRQSIELVLAGKQKSIPQYLLDYAGIKSETTYRKASQS